MKKKQTLLTGTPRQIVGGLCLSFLLALLALGGVQHFASSNGTNPDGTRVTQVSSSSDRDYNPDGTRVTFVTPSGDRDAPPQPGNEIW